MPTKRASSTVPATSVTRIRPNMPGKWPRCWRMKHNFKIVGNTRNPCVITHQPWPLAVPWNILALWAYCGCGWCSLVPQRLRHTIGRGHCRRGGRGGGGGPLMSTNDAIYCCPQCCCYCRGGCCFQRNHRWLHLTNGKKSVGVGVLSKVPGKPRVATN